MANDSLGKELRHAKGRKLRVLYVFAGKERDGSLEWWLKELAAGRDLEVDCWDMRRDPKHDLTGRRLRSEILAKVASGYYDVVAGSPPCETFSRARYSNWPGPPPVRSGAYLRGLPHLRGRAKKKVTDGNLFVDFVILLAKAQKACRRLFL